MTNAGPPEPFPGIWEGIIALGAFFFGVISSAVGATWTLGKSREKLVEKIDGAKLELDRRIDRETDTVTQRFGDTAAALRQKINEVELWNRDNFVNKNTFSLVMGEIKEWQNRFEEKIDRRFDKLDEKLSTPDWSGK